MTHLLRRIRAVAPKRWLDVAWLIGSLVFIEIGLRWFTLPAVARAMGCPLALEPAKAVAGLDSPQSRPSMSDTRLSTREMSRLSDAARLLRRWRSGDTCLRRALIAGRVLRLHDPVLRVGVAKVSGTVKAHAWLEIDNHPLDPTDASGYVVLSPAVVSAAGAVSS